MTIETEYGAIDLTENELNKFVDKFDFYKEPRASAQRITLGKMFFKSNGHGNSELVLIILKNEDESNYFSMFFIIDGGYDEIAIIGPDLHEFLSNARIKQLVGANNLIE